MARGFSVFVSIGAKLLPSLNTAPGKVEQRFKQMNRRLRVEVAETKLMMRGLTDSLKGAGGLAAAGGLSMGFGKTIKSGASFMREVNMLRVSGRTAEEVSKAMQQSRITAMEVPTSTLTGNLQLIRETTGAYGKLGHALENLSFNQRLAYMMTTATGKSMEESQHELVAGIQALEIRGSAMDIRRYRKEMESLFQAMVFFSGKEGAFSPGELRNFAKTGNVPLKLMGERFMTRILPSLITETGSGDIIGTQHTAFNNWLNGNTGTGNKSKTQFAQKLGLVTSTDESQLTKTGWKPGAVLNTSLAKEDPFEWVNKVLLPRLTKAGFDVNSTKSLEIGLSSLFGRETAKRFAMGLADPLQRKRLHLEESNINKAMGSEEGYRFMMKHDPTMAWGRLMHKMENLATILGEKVFTDKTIAAIDKFSSGVDKLSSFFDRSPAAAVGTVGGMGLAAAGGFGAMLGLAGVMKWAAMLPVRLIGLIGRGMIGQAPRLLNLVTSFFRTGFGQAIFNVGRLLVVGLIRLGPWLLRGLAMAFGYLSNPAGWVALLVSAGLIIWAYRKEIAAAWNSKVLPWFRQAWQNIQNYALSINWSGIGIRIADALTFGLASKINASSWGSILRGATAGLVVGTPAGSLVGAFAGGGAAKPGMVRRGPSLIAKPATPAPRRGPAPVRTVGKRALGGPIRPGEWYQVNERGEENFMSTRGGSIVPNGARAANLTINAPIHIDGAQSPQEIVRLMTKHFEKLARRQRVLLTD
jgi:hypothetical protein